VLTHSLPYIRKLGVENIVAHRQPMLKRLHVEMLRPGFTPLAPPESTSALVSFAVKDRSLRVLSAQSRFFTRWVVRLA
jgi:hypothetical protein